MALATAMFRKAWNMRAEQAAEMRQVAAQQIKAVDKVIETILDRIVAASNARVIARYEDKIAELEKQKAFLTEKQAHPAKPTASFEDRVEPLLQFLANPWKIWGTGSVQMRRTILNWPSPPALNIADIKALEPRKYHSRSKL